VIGQDEAKRTLAVAVYSHYRKLGARIMTACASRRATCS